MVIMSLYVIEEDGYYEDLYPEPIGGNYSDDLLNVIVDRSTDEESTEVRSPDQRFSCFLVCHVKYVFWSICLQKMVVFHDFMILIILLSAKK